MLFQKLEDGLNSLYETSIIVTPKPKSLQEKNGTKYFINMDTKIFSEVFKIYHYAKWLYILIFIGGIVFPHQRKH